MPSVCTSESCGDGDARPSELGDYGQHRGRLSVAVLVHMARHRPRWVVPMTARMSDLDLCVCGMTRYEHTGPFGSIPERCLGFELEDDHSDP